MALKDLVVSHAELTEEQIENIVSPHARYDPVAKAIVLLPGAMSLSNRQRVIVYLVALRGWPFVVSEDTPPTSATPSEIERSLQIPGGTLRPILKDLRDARLIEGVEGRYSANPVTFPFLEEELQPGSPEAPAARQRRTSKRTPPQSEDAARKSASDENAQSQTPSPPATAPAKKGSTGKRTRRDATAAGGGPLPRLRAMIQEGWFSQPRRTQDIVRSLEARGARYRGQDLTRQLLVLTRANELRREKRPSPESRRPVWYYQT